MPSPITLQLADRSLLKPTGLVENVLIKVGKFSLQMDFVILDIVENKKMTIIFGKTISNHEGCFYSREK